MVELLNRIDPSTGFGALIVALIPMVLLSLLSLFWRYLVEPFPWAASVRPRAVFSFVLGVSVALLIVRAAPERYWLLIVIPSLYMAAGWISGLLDDLSSTSWQARVLRLKQIDRESEALEERAATERAALIEEFPVLSPERRVSVGNAPDEVDLRESHGIDVRVSLRDPIGLYFQTYEPTAEYTVYVAIRELSGFKIELKGNETGQVYIPPMIVRKIARKRAVLHAKDDATIRLCTIETNAHHDAYKKITLTALSSMSKKSGGEHPLAEVTSLWNEFPGRVLLSVRIMRMETSSGVLDDLRCVKEVLVAIEGAGHGDPTVRMLEEPDPQPPWAGFVAAKIDVDSVDDE